MLRQRLGITSRTHPPAADEITHLAAGLAVDRPVAAAHTHGRQARPQPPVADTGHILDHHTRPFLPAAVAVLARRERPHGSFAQLAVQRLGHRRLDVLPQAFLVPFDHQHIIAAARHDLLGDRFLAAEGVDGYQRSAQVQQLQKLGNGRDFVGLAVYRDLCQDQVGLRGPGTDQVQRPQRRTGRAAQRLAVDGDLAYADQTSDLAQPCQAAALEDAWVQGGEDALERIVAGHAVRQGQEAPEPGLALPGEHDEVGPVVAVADHAADGQDKDVKEQMARAANNPGVLQRAKVFPERSDASRGGHAILREMGEGPENRRAVHLSGSSLRHYFGWSLMRSPWLHTPPPGSVRGDAPEFDELLRKADSKWLFVFRIQEKLLTTSIGGGNDKVLLDLVRHTGTKDVGFSRKVYISPDRRKALVPYGQDYSKTRK